MIHALWVKTRRPAHMFLRRSDVLTGVAEAHELRAKRARVSCTPGPSSLHTPLLRLALHSYLPHYRSTAPRLPERGLAKLHLGCFASMASRDVTTRLRQSTWNGSIPLEIRLHKGDCRTYDESDPYLVRAVHVAGDDTSDGL
jgi:hypothetical protein